MVMPAVYRAHLGITFCYGLLSLSLRTNELRQLNHDKADQAQAATRACNSDDRNSGNGTAYIRPITGKLILLAIHQNSLVHTYYWPSAAVFWGFNHWVLIVIPGNTLRDMLMKLILSGLLLFVALCCLISYLNAKLPPPLINRVLSVRQPCFKFITQAFSTVIGEQFDSLWRWFDF